MYIEFTVTVCFYYYTHSAYFTFGRHYSGLLSECGSTVKLAIAAYILYSSGWSEAMHEWLKFSGSAESPHAMVGRNPAGSQDTESNILSTIGIVLTALQKCSKPGQ